MTSDKISINNARTHNLKNVSVELPRNRLNVITGVSGSGKSSLAYDTIYAEGQRRYVESLSAYARQFLSVMEKPDVDSIDGLSPAVSINQQAARYNPRSTVGTLTEIYDYLRLLYARVGEPRCPEHGIKLAANTISQLVDFAMAIPEGSRIALLAPVVRHRKGEHEHVINQLRKEGFVRIRIDGIVYDTESVPKLERYANHTIEVVVDRVIIRDEVRTRLAESIETAVSLADGTIILCGIDAEGQIEQTGETYSTKYGCPHCGFVLNELEPRIFSFNNPSGACKTCNGLGNTSFMDPEKIVVAPDLSLAEGALAFWNPSYRYYFSILKSLAKQYEFSVKTPFSQLPDAITDIILYGTGTESVKLRLYRPSGRPYRRTRPFEGVVNNFERRYLETESDGIKEELAKYLTSDTCADCNGSRLAPGPRYVFVDGKSIHEIIKLNVEQCIRHMSGLNVERQQAEIAHRILLDIRQRLKFLASVGLTYVTLDRPTSTLSGGELQRIRLASQIGSGLVGVTYVLDEPSIGLHERDQRRLLDTLFHLRDIGNTLVVVEHDETTIRAADFVVDLGPGAGKHGGQLLVAGHHEEVAKTASSITGQYLCGNRRIPVPHVRKSPEPNLMLRIERAAGNNLKDIDVDIPLGLMTCITGVSGSGKSTLLNGTIYPALHCSTSESLEPNISTRRSTSTSSPLVGHRAQILQPTPDCLHPSGNSFPEHLKHAHEATNQAGFRSTCRVDAANPAAVTDWCVLKCTFYRTFSSPARHARAQDITAKRSKSLIVD